jgi:hypothetical protein
MMTCGALLSAFYKVDSDVTVYFCLSTSFIPLFGALALAHHVSPPTQYDGVSVLTVAASSHVSIYAARKWQNQTEIYHFEYQSGGRFLEADVLVARYPRQSALK